jgi:hypothetical protein
MGNGNLECKRKKRKDLELDKKDRGIGYLKGLEVV